MVYPCREHRFRPGREQTYRGRVTLEGVRDGEWTASSGKPSSVDFSARPHSVVGVAKLGLRRWFAKPVSLRDSWVQIPPPALPLLRAKNAAVFGLPVATECAYL